MTNADRIRAMTDEELAGWMNHLFPTLAYEWLLDWLKKEADNG